MEINNSKILECENLIDKMTKMIGSLEEYKKYSAIIYNRFNCFNYLEYYDLFSDEIKK